MENNLMPIILSSRFREILARINDDISRFILNLEHNNDYAFSFSFVDITDDESSISFLPVSKYADIPMVRGNGDLVWSCSTRNLMKSGRLINKIAPCYKHAEIEKWVNNFKAECKNILKNIKFKVVEGSDIVKFYNGKRYGSGNGSLNKSCMRHDQCSDWMNLYIKNPDKIKMLILMESKDIISGRALLWKLDDPADTWLLDRIYVKEDSDAILFKKYAEKSGWLYKNMQTFDAVNVVKDGKETFVPMKVYIKGEYKYFPYIDTLLFYNKKDNYLTNIENDYESSPHVTKLREINGKDSGNEYFIFDVLNKEYLKAEDSRYCYLGDGYTHKNFAFFMKDYDEYIFPTELRYSKYSKKFMSSRQSVFSKNLGSFVNTLDIVQVYYTKDGSVYDYILKTENGKSFARLNESFYSMDLLIKGIDDEYYFKDEYDEATILMQKDDEYKIMEEVIKSSKFVRETMGLPKENKKIITSTPYDAFFD